jgi:hypothetical protein
MARLKAHDIFTRAALCSPPLDWIRRALPLEKKSVRDRMKKQEPT